ncbi:BglG family transcription antiterminator [Paenibacillus azoreducens]|uniref:Transcriptional regulator MtlR n=1 Tax=Paenibacillus azoreducens TaxID=116718 RepID=A0A919YAF4_9BACL|nr:BglG family transcription antiterminator [Paenibacillus azoreducens]GIO47946.1 transcriptional regulator MtlR [Paenibacillus azoreducens]
MELTHRVGQILGLLLRSPYESTVAEIASSIRVSPRTVHRELDAVESYLHRYGITLHRKAGSGLIVEGKPDEIEKVRSELLVPANVEFSADERQIYLLYRLLASREPVKLFTLAHEMKVTVPTIGADLDDLTDWIGNQGLLLIRRRGYGVEITGSESLIREAIRNLIQYRLDDLWLIAGAGQKPLHPVDAKMAELAGVDCITVIEEILWKWEEMEQKEPFSEDAYTDLLIRLSIAASRIRSGIEVSEAEAARLANLQGFGRAGGMPLPDTKLKAADTLCRQLGEALNTTYSSAEVKYAAELLERASAHSSGMLPADDLELAGSVRSFIRKMGELDANDYTADRSLRDGLFTHLKAAMERISAGQRIRNPLLEAIRKNYSVLFGRVRQAADIVFPTILIPDEEIAFLVMHFGASRERLGQVHPHVRAVIVCTSGIGTSKMLAARLRKEFPQMHIVEQASWYEAARIPKTNYDLIISTVDLSIPEEQYLKLSPLLTPAEADKLRDYIRRRVMQKTLNEIRADKPKPPKLLEDFGPPPGELESTASCGEADRRPEMEGLLSLSKTVQQSIELLEAFRVLPLRITGAPSLGKWLRAACNHPELGEVISDPEAVVLQLLQREQHGTQLIPGTELALFHTRSEMAKRPSLMLFELDQPFKMDDSGPVELSRFLLMLAPRQLTGESLKVLSEISATLLDSDMIEALAEGREHRIRDLMSAHLRAYLKNKLERE